jgi:hypothetical protein
MAKSSNKKGRGSGLYLLGLNKSEMRILRRAVQFAGYPSLSNWLQRQRRAIVVEQTKLHGDLLKALTPDEAEIIAAMRATGTPVTVAHLSEDTHLTEAAALRVLRDLIDSGIVEPSRQFKITATARGATNPEYRLSPKYQHIKP